MEQYEYKVLAKKDFIILTGNIISDEFSADRFNKELSHFGSEGYRVITKLYNAPNDWVLVLSRPLAYLPKNRRA